MILKVNLGEYEAKKINTAIAPAEAPIIGGFKPSKTGNKL
jgi:hypothetical protein